MNDEDTKEVQELVEAAITERTSAAVTEALGLKSGQTLSDVVGAIASESTRNTLGIEEGQDAKKYFSGIITKTMSENGKPDEKPDPKPDPKPDAKSPTGEDAALAAMKTEFVEMKKQTKELVTQRDDAIEAAHESKRTNSIQSLVDDFNVKPEMKKMIINSFVHGLEGPAMDLNDSGALTIKDENGAPREAKAYMDDYFKNNAWMLNAQKRKGSRTVKGDPKTDVLPDLSKTEDGKLVTGVALVDSYVKLAESDSDSALEALKKSNRSMAEALGMPQ